MINSCDKNELNISNNVEKAKVDLIKKIGLIKNDAYLPLKFKNHNEDIENYYKFIFNELDACCKKSKDIESFYEIYNKILSKNSYLLKDFKTNTTESEVIREYFSFITELYFKELEVSNYNYIRTGIIFENAILQNSLIEDNNRDILCNYIYNLSVFLNEISCSGVLTKDSKITEKAFLKCVDKELDSVFNNPIKTIQFLISPPINFAWLSAGCVWETWNS